MCEKYPNYPFFLSGLKIFVKTPCTKFEIRPPPPKSSDDGVMLRAREEQVGNPSHIRHYIHLCRYREDPMAIPQGLSGGGSAVGGQKRGGTDERVGVLSDCMKPDLLLSVW